MKKFLAMLLALVMVLSMAACAAPAENKTDDKAAQDDFQSQILFCGSTSLYPIISSLASSFTEKYVTWDKVNAQFPNSHISVYVAPGGSGVGVKAAVDGTADFGMLARDIKDSEIESLGENYKAFVVAKDALTVSINAQNPLCEKTDSLDTDTIRKIFAGEIATWDQVDASLPAETINVYIRDLSGGAYEVFQSAVNQTGLTVTPVWESISQTTLMEAVHYGLGVTILPEQMIKREIREGRLAQITFSDFSFQNTIHIAYHHSKYLSPSIKNFILLIKTLGF